MANVNLMGFKKVDRIKTSTSGRQRGIYEDLIRHVQHEGGIYALDTKDHKRAKSLIATLRSTIRRMDVMDLTVVQRGTTVYLVKGDE